MESSSPSSPPNSSSQLTEVPNTTSSPASPAPLNRKRTTSNLTNTNLLSLDLGISKPSGPELSADVAEASSKRSSRRNSGSSMSMKSGDCGVALAVRPTDPNGMDNKEGPILDPTSANVSPIRPTGIPPSTISAIHASSPYNSRPASVISRTSASTISTVPTVGLPSTLISKNLSSEVGIGLDAEEGEGSASGLLSPSKKGRSAVQLLRAQSQVGLPSSSTASSPTESPSRDKGKGKQREEIGSPTSQSTVPSETRTTTPSKPSRLPPSVPYTPRRNTSTTVGRFPSSSTNVTDPSALDKVKVRLEDWPPDISAEGEDGNASVRWRKRRYYVLTNAGKPVFCSHEAQSDEDELTNMMGVAQAIISIYAEEGDKIRSIQSGEMKVVFLLRPPLYLFCTSDWGEPEYVLRGHLEYLYLQMLSVVTGAQLTKVFQKRSNFDLRRLLDGTDAFCHSLLNDLQSEFTYMTSTLQPLRMNGTLRDMAAAALIPPAKMQDLLYVLLIAGGQIVTLLRPKKHSIHPTDLHLLLNILKASPALRTSETWLPICLPKFNSDGFVYAFISYLKEEVGMVFLSADRDGFEGLRGWKEVVMQKLGEERIADRLQEALVSSPYSVSDIGVPGLRHFFYKSRKNVQLTAPIWEGPYSIDGPNRWSLMTLYQTVYDAIHARSGQSTPLKQFYVRTETEACMGWITQPFELYLAISPDLSKSAVVSAANAIVKWVNKQETKLFLREAPVF